VRVHVWVGVWVWVWVARGWRASACCCVQVMRTRSRQALRVPATSPPVCPALCLLQGGRPHVPGLCCVCRG
jgi:hypothetical protein